MLAERMFEDISVKDLCERAMIRRTTFYKHFADKYEYLNFYLSQIRDEFQEEDDGLAGETTAAYALRMTKKLIGFINTHENMVNRILDSSTLTVFLDSLAEQIIADIGEKLKNAPDGELLPEILASFYAGGLLQTLRWWYARKKAVSEEELFEAIRVLFHAFEPAS